MVIMDDFLGIGPEDLGQRDDVAYFRLPATGKEGRKADAAREAVWEWMLNDYGRVLAGTARDGPIYSLHPPRHLSGAAQTVRLVGSLAYPGRIRVVETPESRLFAAYLARLFAALAKKETDAAAVEEKVRRLAGEAVALIREGNKWREIRWFGVGGLNEKAARQRLQTEVGKGRALVASWRGGGGKGVKKTLEFLGDVAGRFPLREYAGPAGFGYVGRDHLEIFFYPRV